MIDVAVILFFIVFKWLCHLELRTILYTRPTLSSVVYNLFLAQTYLTESPPSLRRQVLSHLWIISNSLILCYYYKKNYTLDNDVYDICVFVELSVIVDHNHYYYLHLNFFYEGHSFCSRQENFVIISERIPREIK